MFIYVVFLTLVKLMVFGVYFGIILPHQARIDKSTWKFSDEHCGCNWKDLDIEYLIWNNYYVHADILIDVRCFTLFIAIMSSILGLLRTLIWAICKMSFGQGNHTINKWIILLSKAWQVVLEFKQLETEAKSFIDSEEPNWEEGVATHVVKFIESLQLQTSD